MNANSKMTLLTRVGFATRGLIYLVIGFLVIGTGRTGDPAGALKYVANGAGRTLIAIMAAGLVAYGIWRMADAAFGSDRKGALERAGAGISGGVWPTLNPNGGDARAVRDADPS